MSKIQLKDETLFCERCGISFIWAAEEQSQSKVDAQPSQPQPSRCTGCRHLMPTSGRERGQIVWYNPRKRYGFIVRRDHPSVFMHGSDIEGRVRVQPGDLVEFRMGETARGPCAHEIRLLSKNSKRPQNWSEKGS